MATGTRDALHDLVERLPDPDLHAAQRFLESLVAGGAACDPLLMALDAAPEDDEELSPEEEASMTAAYDRHIRRQGSYVSNEEMARRLGE